MKILTGSSLPPIYIVLIVVLSILAIYFILFVFNVISVFTFRINMNKHKNSLCLYYATKCEIYRKLFPLLIQKGIDIPDKLLDMLVNIKAHDFKDPYSKRTHEVKESLILIEQSISSLILKNKLNIDEEYLLFKSGIDEAEKNIRGSIILYNNDVIGYNYWVRFLPFRYLFLLFKIKTKKTI